MVRKKSKNDDELEVDTKKEKSDLNTVEEPAKLNSRANLVVIAIITSVSALLASILIPASQTSQVTPDIQYTWRLALNIINSEFADKSMVNAIKSCSGTKSFPNITGSKIFVSDNNDRVLFSTEIPEANQIGYSNCDYEMKLSNNIDNIGTQVKVWAVFPFGQSEKFKVDIGNSAPYIIKLDLNFS